MRSIRDQLNEAGYSIPDAKGDFGFEIETEVNSPLDYPTGFLKEIPHKYHHYWDFPGMMEFKGHYDGSLRGFGVEFVFRKPMAYEASDDALRKFGALTHGVPFIQGSPGTSVHVHMNLAKHSWCTLGNFLTAYSLVENVLAVFAGPTRTSNLFALPLRCAEVNHSTMVDIFTGIEAGKITGIQQLSDESHKYAAMNLAPLYRLGSVESRLMRGTTDPDLLRLWLKILNELLEFSQLSGLTPRDVVEEYNVSPDGILRMVFPTTYSHLPDEPLLMTPRSVFYAAWLADCVKDWGGLELPAPKKPRSKQKSDFPAPSAYPMYLTKTDVYIFTSHTGAMQNKFIEQNLPLIIPGKGTAHWNDFEGKWVIMSPPSPAVASTGWIANPYVTGLATAAYSLSESDGPDEPEDYDDSHDDSDDLDLTDQPYEEF